MALLDRSRSQGSGEVCEREATQFLEQALGAAKLVPDVPAEKLAWAATTLGDVCVLLGRYEEAREAPLAQRRST